MFPTGAFNDFILEYLISIGELNTSKRERTSHSLFEEETFNKLSQKAVEQLKERVKEIVLKREVNLNDAIYKGRLKYYRYGEPWGTNEENLLLKSLEYTNDVKLLSECFGRTESSIIGIGTKLLNKKSVD